MRTPSKLTAPQSASHRHPTAALVVGLALLGCSDRDQIWSEPLQVTGPYAAADQALWLDGTRGLVFCLEPSSPATMRVETLRRQIISARVDSAKSRLYLLSAGQERQLRDQIAEPPALSVVEPRPGQPPQIDIYPLPSAFERIVLAEDGRTALLHQSADGTANRPQRESSLFRNPNQIAIVALDEPAGENNPTLRSLRSFGSAPLGAVISPPMSIAERDPRRLAVVLSRNYLTIFDLDNLDRREITVRLTPDSASAAADVVPRQVVFAPTEGLIFVRADGAEDVFALALQPIEATDAGANDFRPSISQPSAGRVVRDMLLVGDAPARLLTANAGGDLALIDVSSGAFVLHQVQGSIDTLVGHPEQSPTQVLAFSRGDIGTRVNLIDVAALVEGSGDAIVSRSAGQPLRDLVVSPDGTHALLIHDKARTVVSVIDLAGEHRTVTPIEGDLPLQSFDFTADNQLVGASPGLQRLGFLRLDNLTSSDVRLDHTPRAVVSLGDQVLVDHGADQGLATLVPAPDATQSEPRVLWGFLLDGLLDRQLRD